ncbi:unnamed protein product [Cylindrotheca closterium]|uniref:Conserved oligomeric Golgi complex subunit 1 n=1 Tax=Cylindrotheca closterium TaxID=2856 RepID=A0AAD2FSV0_9STRA|nr:unnamed protein product [Cylindrotheca closterium]
MSSLPRPPGAPTRRSSSNSTSYGKTTTPRTPSPQVIKGTTRHISSGSLPPPPTMVSPNPKKGQSSNYAQNLSRSMTIEEMRELHRRAQRDAEAKQTELRLVLASRYRELVGSSDEVTKMGERAQELHELVHALPELMGKLIQCAEEDAYEEAKDAGEEAKEIDKVTILRQDLAALPRRVHRALDTNNVHEATVSLLLLFRLIAEQTQDFPLASALATDISFSPVPNSNSMLQAQIKMTFLHVQTLPAKITRQSTTILDSAASFGSTPEFGAETSAAALSTLDLLDIAEKKERTTKLLDMYFDSKAALLQGFLTELNPSNSDDGGTDNTEEILSKIVLILQYDIILHPYQMFILRNFPCAPQSGSTVEGIMKSLPMFPASIVQSKVSNFLSAHLPLIRTKVKSVLVNIAGTTASALGKIRQSLYDKTDGLECMERLDNNGICSWEEAVSGVVDVQVVLSSSHGGGGPIAHGETTAIPSKFSLWGVLFSNTFSSLVHSLLTTSFQSVHTKVVSTLRESLANAPALSSILPHEAYRNTLHIATELDSSLLKVSADAHELLVHAEERDESERRLKQSLYVQTCEIVGRLLSELRRMLLLPDKSQAVMNLIVGRLCHLLKYRLTALPTLLDPNSSPAVLAGSSGMISLLELSSAFELADDNDDGLITFQEAMEAVDSAFSGTQHHGAEMVRETLLLPAVGEKDVAPASMGANAKAYTPQDVTLNELTLLLARGLRHEQSGKHSALGTVQESLDAIITESFNKWSKEVLDPSSSSLSTSLESSIGIFSSYSEEEYKRIYAHAESPIANQVGPVVGGVSPHVTAFVLELSSILDRSVCPSDSLLPVPSVEYATAMGISGDDIPRMVDTIRWALLHNGLETVTSLLDTQIGSDSTERKTKLSEACPSGLIQLCNDISFIRTCFFVRNTYSFDKNGADHPSKTKLDGLYRDVTSLSPDGRSSSVVSRIEESHRHVFEVSDLFLSSLFGEDKSSSVPLGDISDIGSSIGQGQASGASSMFHTPVPSSCRFQLLPIQADRTLSGVQARTKLKEKEAENRADSVGTGAMRAGLGFFSSMLTKN